jgi:cellulose synthase/poly-beta-1,6-N-acetylglucosamine synthase-like glycosyltransferase
MTSVNLILAICHMTLLAPLAVLGLHKAWVVLLWWRRRQYRTAAGDLAGRTPPKVTIQLPVYNERFVVARLIQTIAQLDYPHSELEIQILDDSTDDTTDIISQTLGELPASLAIHHIRRGDRTGFKAGALAYGLTTASGEFIAIFDADFLPPPDFLQKTVSHFDNPKVGLVQARWGHTNREHSGLTQIQALLLDGHFRIEQSARATNHCLFNFNGTAGLFRRQCIEDAGGWHHDTLTEDLDLSYRAQLAGWQFLYLPDLRCPAELPTDMNGFLTQQNRWAKGSIQTGRKHLGTVWRSELSRMAKIEASFHLLSNLAFPLLFSLILVAMPLQFVRFLDPGAATWELSWIEELPLLFATLSVLIYFGLSQLSLHRLSLSTVLRLPLVLSMGAGACLNNTFAVLSAFRRDPGEFRRTPKNTPANPEERAKTYRSPRGALPYFEVLLGCWAFTTTVLASLLGHYSTATFHGLFGLGLLWVGLQSLRSNRQLAVILPLVLLVSCTGSGGSSGAAIVSDGPPEIVTSQARIGKEHNLTEIVFATRRGLAVDDLPSRPGKELGIRMHPDGVRVLFTRERRSNDATSREIFVSSIDRSYTEQRLTVNAVLDDGGCWSPDGEDLAFSSQSSGNLGSRDLWRMTANGNSAQRLTNGDFEDRDPDWHNNGIVFSRRPLNSSDPARLFVLDPVSTNISPITDGGANEGDYEPAWAPDGKSVLFIRRASADLQVLMRYVLGTSKPAVISDGIGIDRFPRWSPQGDRIFVARSRPVLGLDGLRLYGTMPDGSDPLLLFPDARFAYLGFDAVPTIGAYQTPTANAVDVDEKSGLITMRLGATSGGYFDLAKEVDGKVLRVTTAAFNNREVAGILLTQDLGFPDPTKITAVRIRVTMALSRTSKDSKLRLAVRNHLLQRYDTVLNFSPPDSQLQPYEFSTSSLAHIDRSGLLRLEVIADLDPATPAELVVDGIEIELRVLPDGK